MRLAKRNIVGTLKNVADHHGIALATVREWRGLGMPGRRGRWDLDEIEAWQQARTDSVPIAGLDEAMARAKLAHEEAKAKRAQINLEREQGKLMETIEHRRVVREQARWFVGVMERATSELIVELAELVTDHTEARRRMERWFGAVRKEAAK